MDKRIKILYTIPNFKTAGSQYVLLSLFRTIDKTAFAPFICIEKFPEIVPKDISPTESLFFEWKGNKFQDVKNFRSLLKDYKIDIVHSWDYKSNYFEALACRLTGVKYLFTKKNNAWSKRWIFKGVLANHIAYDNPEMKNRFFNSYVFRNKVTFIPHGIDTEIFKPLEKIHSPYFNIGCIGNIGENKNQLYVIKVLRKLPENMILHLYGNEEQKYRERIDNYIKKYGLGNRVVFHGFIENHHIPSIFQKLDLFILASIQEGLPVSILEALACGVMVLSSDSGGGSKYLLAEENIFDLNNPEEFISKILKLYHLDEKKRNAIRRSEIQKIANYFTVQIEVNAYENLYRNLMDSNN